MEYLAYVDNIGCIGEYRSKDAAVSAIRQTIAGSQRADNHGVVLYGGEIVAEIGEPREDS